MTEKEPKNLILSALKESARELRKGNARGYRIIDNTLDSIAALYDDEEMLFMQATVGSLSVDFLEREAEIEGAQEFMKEIADILESIAKAFESGNSAELNELYRKLYMCVNKRWKDSRRLTKIEKKQ